MEVDGSISDIKIGPRRDSMAEIVLMLVDHVSRLAMSILCGIDAEN